MGLSLTGGVALPVGWARIAIILASSACWMFTAFDMSRAQSVDSTLWGVGPGDKVFAAARDGNMIYVGGNFATMGSNSGGGVPIDILSAHGASNYPRVAGRVNAVVADGVGGWYIGGWFAGISGRAHANLAHLGRTGVDDAWTTSANGEVFALALAGSRLYVGGEFDSLGGQSRLHLAEVNATSGVPTSWNPQVNDRVSTLLVTGSNVYAGGRFRTVGGQSHRYVAAIDRDSALPTVWDPGIDAELMALALRDSTLLLGGYFANVAGVPRRCLAAINVNSGAVLPWDANLTRTPDYIYDGGPRVVALLLRDSLLYVAGSFKTIGGQSREGLAAINANTAQATSWAPRSHSAIVFGAYFRALAISGDTLFVAGQADSLGNLPGSYLAALRISTAARLDWDPRPNWEVFALATEAGTLYAAGGFTSMGDWVRRRNLAAFDAATGVLTSWDPEADDYVNAIVIRDNAVYVGGVFSSVGGQPRANLAALDANSGAATLWNPAVNGSISSIAPWRNTMLIAGSFTGVGGQARNNIAAIDIATGLATSWDPNANDIVYSVVPGDSVIYAGGWFGVIGGQPRATLAALDPVTGLATPWSPRTDGFVNAIATLHGTIYVGGYFNFANGVERNMIAAIDGSGVLTSWTANAGNEVLTLAASDSTVYAGGFFLDIGGQARNCIAALDARTGSVKDWNPHADGFVWGLAVDGGLLYAVGTFGRMGNWPHSGVAAITPADVTSPSPPVVQKLTMSQSAPNPALDSATIRFSLPILSSVSLEVFDLQGRRVASILSHSLQAAGTHQVSVRTAGWRAGCYLYRLEAAGMSATRKMVVIQ